MSAVQEATGQRERGQGPLRRLFRWPSGWPLLAMPTSLIVYVLVVLACDMTLIGSELAATPPDRPLEEMLQQPGCPNFFWALTDLPSPFIDLHKGLQSELFPQMEMSPRCFRHAPRQASATRA